MPGRHRLRNVTKKRTTHKGVIPETPWHWAIARNHAKELRPMCIKALKGESVLRFVWPAFHREREAIGLDADRDDIDRYGSNLVLCLIPGKLQLPLQGRGVSAPTADLLDVTATAAAPGSVRPIPDIRVGEQEMWE
jgi:hypothetical protein